jgi:hypothetical protein
MQRSVPFMVIWLVAHVIGFSVGSWLGATDGGWLPSLLLETPLNPLAFVAGDAVFGLSFGLAQGWVLSWRFSTRFWRQWGIASVIGFTIGAVLGRNLVPLLTGHLTMAGLLFGVLVGGMIGVSTWLLARPARVTRPPTWLLTWVLAWIVGESIAFASGFSQSTVPLVGLAIGVISGLALIWLPGNSQVVKPHVEPVQVMAARSTHPDG